MALTTNPEYYSLSILLVATIISHGTYGMTCNQIHNDSYLICKLFESTDIQNKISKHIVNFSEPNYCIYNHTQYFQCNDNRITSVYFNNTISSGELNSNYLFPSYLKQLIIINNDLTGYFNFSSLSNSLFLQDIQLDHNQFEAELDIKDWDVISSLHNLQKITINNERNNKRKFSGLVEMSTGNTLPLAIRHFDIGYNHFTFLDWNILNISKNETFYQLETFKIHENDFIGTINWNLFRNLHTINQKNKDVVRHLRFEDNKFHGSIDYSIFYDFTHLQNLDLSDNDFKGQIDFDVVNYLWCNASLERFHCDDSRFWGFVNFEELLECNNGTNSTLDIKIGSEIRCDIEMESFNCNEDSLIRYEESCEYVDECVDSCACGILCNQPHNDSYLLCSITQNTNIQAMIYQSTGINIWNVGSLCQFTDYGFFGLDFVCVNDRIIKVELSGISIEGILDTQNYEWPRELEWVDFHNNEVTGVFYTQSIAKLTKLRYGDISGNNLTAEINWNHLRNLYSLEILLMHSNNFYGEIDWSVISYLSKEGNLSEFNVKNNYFNGYVDFRNISSNLKITMDTNIQCNPAIYCQNNSRILYAPADRASVECTGRIECEQTCQCQRAAVLYTTTQLYIVKDKDNSTIYIALAASLVFLCVLIIIYVKIIKAKSITFEDIFNPLVVIISIGDYDNDENNIENNDVELDTLIDLPVQKDVENLKELFETLKYKCIPKKIKLHWTQQEILSFIKESEKQLFVDSECNELQHDGLIVCISCHGIEDHIITSDYCTINKTAIHRMYSLRHPNSREIPRIFLFDSCAGNAKRGRPKNESIMSQQRSASPSDVNKQNSTDEIGKYFGINDLNKQNSTAIDNTWTTENKNPDWKLVVVHASNPGFQARLDTRKGSYLLFEFANRMKQNIEQNKNMTLGEIFDDIQNDLHEDGKQQTVNVFNNQTRNIRLNINDITNQLTHGSPVSMSPHSSLARSRSPAPNMPIIMEMEQTDRL
eukprot:79403_1